MLKQTLVSLATLVALLAPFALPATAAVTIDWVTVGDPGNACDPQTDIFGGAVCFGAVDYAYNIGTYEVTNAQYAEFLNAVAATDTNALYNTEMADPFLPVLGGITRSGSPGSYTYTAISGRENLPVNLISFYAALRFANWLQNGQPTGAQDTSTTEDGAYTITEQGITDNSITRNSGATIFLPSEDEWYKAAYYNASAASYFDYPAGSDTLTTCAAPTATPNTANCGNSGGDLTDVGSYTGSASPYGTFDQGANVWEWNETIGVTDFGRIIRGGSYALSDGFAASDRSAALPTSSVGTVGFRLASIPGPSNEPPDCGAATADPAKLWPPNPALADVSVVGVTDADGDSISITIDSIFQDEPVSTVGHGNTVPDGAGVGTDTAGVRAERNGSPKTRGNGRVYHVSFTADDGQGRSCNGTVNVCVPHDQRRGATCVDDGPLYNSIP